MPRQDLNEQSGTVRMLSGLPAEVREAAVRSIQRAALQEAYDFLNSGRRVPVEPPQKNSRRSMDENVI